MSFIDTNIGRGGGVGDGLTIAGTSVATGVVLPQTGILPVTGGSSLSFMVVTAAVTFAVMITSHLIARAIRAYNLRQA
jgi:hypothetical protein